MGEQKPNVTVSLDKSDVEGKDDTKETIRTEEDGNDGESTVTQGDEEEEEDDEQKKGSFYCLFVLYLLHLFTVVPRNEIVYKIIFTGLSNGL